MEAGGALRPPSPLKEGIMDKENVLVPITKDVIVNGKTYQISKLTLGQILKLSSFMFRIVVADKAKLKVLSETTKDNKSNVEDLLALLDLLNEKDVAELTSILLKEKIKSIAFDDSLELIAAVCELNDFNKVKKNFQRIINALKIEKKTS